METIHMRINHGENVWCGAQDGERTHRISDTTCERCVRGFARSRGVEAEQLLVALRVCQAQPEIP